MEKYKFRSTVYLVFLVVSLFVNGLLLYMLITGYPQNQECEKLNNNTNMKEVMKEINTLYSDAYDLINGENSSFYVPTSYVNENIPDYACYLVNTDGLKNYFTEELLGEIEYKLLDEDGIRYDCNGEIQKMFFSGLFGLTDQGKRELKYVMSDTDTILVSGKLSSNEFINGDIRPLYMVLKIVDGRLLIDSFE